MVTTTRQSSSPLSNSSMVDRAARQAQQQEDALPDLMLPGGLPFRPALWMIVIEPLTPRSMSDGGIEVVTISQEAEGHQVTVGRVLKAGIASFEGKTTSGIELCHFLPDVSTPEQLVGKFVIYQQHVGQILTMRKTGQQVKVMKVTDLLGDTNDPHAWKFYI